MQADSLPYEPPGKPNNIHIYWIWILDKNTGVGCHSLLQGIFLTQGLNPGLPHCRHILLPYELPGKPKNIRAGSHSFLQGIFPTHRLNLGFLHYRQTLYHLSIREAQSESVSHSVVSNFLQPDGLSPPRPLSPWNSPGKNTGVGSHSLLQGIFPTQGSNSNLFLLKESNLKVVIRDCVVYNLCFLCN